MNEEANANEPGLIIGVLIIGLILAYNIAPMPFIESEGEGLIATGIYIYFIGSLFIVSYYYSHKSFLFRLFMGLCEFLSWPSSRKMAFFYFGLSLMVGSLAIYDGIRKIYEL